MTRDAYVAADGDEGTRNGRRALRPLQRLQMLCDEGSLHVIRSEVSSERMGDKAEPGDGVIGGTGRIGGRPVLCYAQDATFAGGSVGRAHADTVVRVLQMARRAQAPVVGFIESAGARLQEGLEALDGYARIFFENVALSERVPQISIVAGTSAGGGCYSPALTDFVVMTEAASMFLTGPGVVREVTGEDTDAPQLGGPQVHSRNGVCQLVVPGDVDAVLLVRQLLSFLPQSTNEAPPRRPGLDPEERNPSAVVPIDGRRTYDVRGVARGIVDAGSLLEISAQWAPNMVTSLARLEGRPIGLVANQPMHLGGVIDHEASQKAAQFIRTCNAYGIALIVLVDTPGFLPGRQQEASGVIRHGASLLNAFADATVPRMTVVLRKAFGGAYITMNSKDLGADLSLAWPEAEMGIMSPEQAVNVLYRRELTAAADPERERHRLAELYRARHLSATMAAREGHIDEVVLPNQTRARLAWALATVTP